MTVYHINRFYAGMTPNDTLDQVGAATKVVGDIMRDFAAIYSPPRRLWVTWNDPLATYEGAFGMFPWPDGSYAYGLMMQRKDNDTNAVNHSIWMLDVFGNVHTQSVLNEYQTSPTTFATGGFAVDWNSPFVFFQLKNTVSNPKRVYFINTYGSSNIYVSYTPTYATGRMYRYDSGGSAMILSDATINDIIQMRVVFDRLYITNGNYIAQVDDEGVFNDKRYTLPTGWRAVDFDVVGTHLVIIAKRDNTNEYQGLFWDMVETSGYVSNFAIPLSQVLWVRNFGDQIYIAGGNCNKFSIYRLSYSAPGATLIPVGSVGVASEKAFCSGVYSDKRTVSVGSNQMLFGLGTSDLSGVFSFGRLDATTPFSLSCLYETTNSIRFTYPTRDYLFYSEYDASTNSWATYKAYVGDALGEKIVYESKTFGNPYTHSRVKQAIVTLRVPEEVTLDSVTKFYPKLGVKVDGSTNVYWLTPVSGSQRTAADGTVITYRASGVPIGRFYRIVVEFLPVSSSIPRIGISSISLDVQDNQVFS